MVGHPVHVSCDLSLSLKFSNFLPTRSRLRQKASLLHNQRSNWCMLLCCCWRSRTVHLWDIVDENCAN
ncbi:transmembrane protein, putative [Medicago truncatula]|uniref:Transmembrane protein, putative n=1 Tax=Medicago truncatula TaxID=3880 RepID=A0A072VNE3_MEDTR|nr:transmembrane protein, putative [Medicago truncatula]